MDIKKKKDRGRNNHLVNVPVSTQKKNQQFSSANRLLHSCYYGSRALQYASPVQFVQSPVSSPLPKPDFLITTYILIYIYISNLVFILFHILQIYINVYIYLCLNVPNSHRISLFYVNHCFQKGKASFFSVIARTINFLFIFFKYKCMIYKLFLFVR